MALVSVLVFISLAFVLFSCGGNDGSGSGTVAVYVTDDLGTYSQVTATINSVQLVSTGTPTATCDVLTTPVTLNIANLTNVLQLVNVAQCPARPYNRIRIDFERNVELMSEPTQTTLCSFTSLKDMGSGRQPDVLHCDPATNTCRLDINGAVNVLANQTDKIALDFDLKNFSVNPTGVTGCEVTMKVSPVHANQFGTRLEAITGIVSGLNTTAKTFDLTRGPRTFHVLYSGIITSDQPGLDLLLHRAQDDRLRTKVMSSNIDIMNNTINASSIRVKVEGIVSDLVSGSTFTVVYQNGTKTIGVDYSGAIEVSGTVQEGFWVDVKLYGNSGIDNEFLASDVEVESMGMMTED
jgi:hypothetical protein